MDLVNDYECRCPPGYAGDDCSIDLDPCAKEPCVNGSCLIDSSTHQFSCKCINGYTGTYNFFIFFQKDYSFLISLQEHFATSTSTNVKSQATKFVTTAFVSIPMVVSSAIANLAIPENVVTSISTNAYQCRVTITPPALISLTTTNAIARQVTKVKTAL